MRRNVEYLIGESRKFVEGGGGLFFGGVGRGDRRKKREESDELLDQQRVNVDRSVSRYLLEKILKTDIAEQLVETMMARVMSDGPSSRSNSLTGHR